MNWTFCSATIWIIVVFSHLLGSVCQADEWSDALEQAGENRTELEQFIIQAEEKHGEFGKEAATFLVRYMPKEDLRSLDASFLIENLDYAMRARAEFPWAGAVSKDIFFNDVLPYACLDETRERWRPEMFSRCKQIVSDASSMIEAVQALNRELFNEIKVHYSTERERPNQSPGESIALGKASCTGLSIILVDACRSVGIPARVTGTPLWTNLRGNHTWTEVWADGWHFTGSDEYDAEGLNRGWFVDDASKALKGEPRHAIYSSSWKKADGHFPMVWDLRNQSVNAVNVTDHYTKSRADKIDREILHMRLRESRDGDRLKAKVELLDELGQVIVTTMTKAGRADMNDIASLNCQTNRSYWLRLTHDGTIKQLPVWRDSHEEMTLDLFWDELPDFAETDESPLSILKTWRATPVSIRPDLDMLDLGEAAMTKEEATEATHMLWAQTAAEIRKEREAELKAGTISQGKHVLRFNEKVFGKQPAEGYSLWISMHGGGGAPAYVNDQQWQNQTNLYTLDEGIYVAPRAPTDTWNLWHQGHIDNLFQRLIENYVACRGVNPNRIYILGYSAGGDGVFQLAPRMADFLAGAAMMAGHPNETQPTGLRNIGFALFMGGDDRAYDRNLIASKWKESLASLHKADPEGYKHWVQIYPRTGHWMNRRDAEALPWLANFTRQPWPQRVEWLQDDVTHNRFYWLSVEDENQIAGQRVTAWVEGQTIRIQADGLESIGLRLSDRLLNLDEALRVIWNEQLVFEGSVERSASVIYQSLKERADSELVATAYLEVNRTGD